MFHRKIHSFSENQSIESSKLSRFGLWITVWILLPSIFIALQRLTTFFHMDQEMIKHQGLRIIGNHGEYQAANMGRYGHWNPICATLFTILGINIVAEAW